MVDMKKIISFIFFLIISCVGVSAQFPDSLIIQTKKVKGFGPFPRMLTTTRTMGEENLWAKAIPTIKNIPKDLESPMFAVLHTDFLQHTYQSYFEQKITTERFNELKSVWNWNPLPAKYSQNFVKEGIAIAAGFDEYGKLKIKVDANNNYDLSDNAYFSLAPKRPDQPLHGDSLLIEVQYQFFDGHLKTAHTWLYLSTSSEEKAVPIELFYAFAEHQYGEFSVNGEKYYVAILSDRAVFRNNYNIKVWTDETEKELRHGRGLQRNEYVRFGNVFYKFVHASIDGSEILLVKDEKAVEKGGHQVGLKAPNFTGTSISGKEIELAKMKGNIVFLDFWGTWCSPCVKEMPELKGIYEKYKTKNFKMIGIAYDDIESLTKYVKENNIEWEQVIQSEEGKPIITSYNILGYPTTFLIDENGFIIGKGMRSQELDIKLEELLD